jgi:outer membrane protein OmpA-like peptidoglycan-associated protein
VFRSRVAGVLVAAVALAGLTGCSGTQNGGGAAANAGKGDSDQPHASVGQQLEALQRAHPVTFSSQSAELSSQDSQTLQQAAAMLKAAPANVTVVTHAGYANAGQAQQLSEQRADAIAKVLETAGVDRSHIKTQPTGNTTAQGEQALQAQITSP